MRTVMICVVACSKLVFLFLDLDTNTILLVPNGRTDRRMAGRAGGRAGTRVIAVGFGPSPVKLLPPTPPPPPSCFVSLVVVPPSALLNWGAQYNKTTRLDVTCAHTPYSCSKQSGNGIEHVDFFFKEKKRKETGKKYCFQHQHPGQKQ